MTQQITAQLLKGGLTVDASGNVTAIGRFSGPTQRTGTIKASDGTTAITIANSTGVITITSPVINTGVSGTAILDENAMGSNSDTKLATQKSIKAYVDGKTHLSLIDEDNMVTDSNTRPPSQQSVKAYVDDSVIEGISSTGSSSTDTVTIAGNLTVDGLTTIINSTTLSVDDRNIELGSIASPDDTTANGGGITLKGATDKTILWTNSTDSWDFNQGISTSGAITTTGGMTITHTPATVALKIDHNGNERALYIDAENTTSNALAINADAMTTGKAAYIYSDSSDTGAFQLLHLQNDNASATGATCLYIKQDSTGPALVTTGGNVGIGTDAPGVPLHVYSADDDLMHLESSDQDCNFKMTGGSGHFQLSVANNNASFGMNGRHEMLRFSDTTDIVINEDGLDLNFRVEGVGSQNALFVQGSDGKVGIGCTPTIHLDVQTATDVVANFKTTGANSDAMVRIQNDAQPFDFRVLGSDGDKFVIRDANAGVNRLIIDTSGKVGIGNTAPYAPLVIGSGAGQKIAFAGSASDFYGIGYATSRARLQFIAGGTTEMMTITDEGKVGIGTAAPDDLLHIYKGDSGAAPHTFSAFNIEHNDNLSMNMLTPTDKYAALYFGDSVHANDGGIIYQHGATPSMTFRVNDATKMTIDSSGNAIIGPASGKALYFGDGDTGFHESSDNQIKVKTGGATLFTFQGSEQRFRGDPTGSPNLYHNAGSASTPVYSFNDDWDTGMYRVGANSIGLATGGTHRMTIDSSGKVVIGTTSTALPSNGSSVRITGALLVQGAMATAYGIMDASVSRTVPNHQGILNSGLIHVFQDNSPGTNCLYAYSGGEQMYSCLLIHQLVSNGLTLSVTGCWHAQVSATSGNFYYAVIEYCDGYNTY